MRNFGDFFKFPNGVNTDNNNSFQRLNDTRKVKDDTEKAQKAFNNTYNLLETNKKTGGSGKQFFG